MVIIKRPTQKRFRREKSGKSFRRVLSVVLSLVLILSVVAFAIPSISAARVTLFTDCEEIYIDVRSFTDWDSASAKTKVYTYYGDSDDDWNRENGEADNSSLYNNGTKIGKAIEAVKFCDHVYSFRIPANNIGYLKVLRVSNDGNSVWSDTGYKYDNQRSKSTGGNRNNCLKITGYSSATWTTFTPTNNASYSEVTATPDTSITSNSKLFAIDATLYDYYTDDEIQNGWGNIRYQSGHSYWEPYQYLNSKIAEQGSGVPFPLYFGNFYGKNDGYIGEGSSNLKNFSNWVNNSSNLGGANKSVVGLTGKKLVNNQLVYGGANNTDTTTNVPIFDKSWLASNKVGSIVNTKFPMRIETDASGNTYYAFDSGANDNVWLSSNHKTISYGKGTNYGAKDALYYYSAPQENSGYGFFPFDSSRGSSKEAYNFGFGMRVDIKFNVGDNGLLEKGNGHEVFEFTGDDDVWVYLDGVLVLDLGGDHKKAHGTIDFNTLTSTVTTGTNTLNNATRNGAFPKLFGASGNQTFNNKDITAEHTLTMFYVERGMVESNLSFNFNFSPVGNEFIVDKTVNVANVNSGLQTAVAAADNFSFNQPTAAGKAYTYKTADGSSSKTATGGVYTLKNGESADFKDQFTPGTSFTVSESESSPLTYTTSWKAIDLEYKNKGAAESAYTIGTGDSTTASFKYETKDTSSEFNMTRVQLSYINTPSVQPVTVKKVVTGLNAGESDTTDFGGTVQISLDNGSTWGTYPLAYTASGVSGTKYLTNAGKLADGAKLRNGRTLTFTGIPTGARLRFVEDATPNGYTFSSVSGTGVTAYSTGGQLTVGTSGNAITVTNNRLSGAATVNAYKTLGGYAYSGEMFTFTLEGLPSMTITGTSQRTEDTEDVFEQVTEIASGNIKFDLTGFNKPGTYRYILKEEPISTGDSQVNQEISINKDKRIYLVNIEMTDDNGSLTPDVTYYSFNGPAPQFNLLTQQWEDGEIEVTAADFNDDNIYIGVPRFENEIKKPSVTVIKKNQANQNVGKKTAFALYKVSGDGVKADIKRANLVQEDADTDGDGIVEFKNLDLYQAGYQNAATASDLKYQWYAIVETKAPEGYTPSDEVIYFRFPIQNSYSFTFSYVNGKIINPNTAGEGMGQFKVIGWTLAGTAVLSLAAYVVLTNRKKKCAPKHIKK